MKFSSMVVGAFAALASAAPVQEVEKRSFFTGNVIGSGFGDAFAFDQFNNGIFNNDPLAYLFHVNGIGFNDVQNIFAISAQQNLAIDPFNQLFNLQKGAGFGLEQVLLAHTFLTVNWLHKNNLIGGVDFNGIQFPSFLQFGVLQDAFNPFLKDFGFNIGLDVNNQIAAILAQSQFNVAHTGFGVGGFGFKE